MRMPCFFSTLPAAMKSSHVAWTSMPYFRKMSVRWMVKAGAEPVGTPYTLPCTAAPAHAPALNLPFADATYPVMSASTPCETRVVTYSAVFCTRQGAFPALTALVSCFCIVSWSVTLVYVSLMSRWLALNALTTASWPLAQPQKGRVTGPEEAEPPEPDPPPHAESRPVRASPATAVRANLLRRLVKFI